jgi:Protein of unknown function (DUF1304)
MGEASTIASGLSRGFRTWSFQRQQVATPHTLIAPVLTSTRKLGSGIMIYIANALVALVAALHIYFLVLEMFLWTRPAFGLSPEKARDSAVLAANQGLYPL